MGDWKESREYLLTNPRYRGKYSVQGIATTVRDSVWDGERRELLGRSGPRWCSLMLFYFCFFCGVMVFFGIVWGLFYITIDLNYPRYNQRHLYIAPDKWKAVADPYTKEETFYSTSPDPHIGLMLPGPGMGIRPMPDHRSTLIRFVQGRATSYKRYTDHIQSYLELYENDYQEGEMFTDCENLRPGQRDKTKVCRFNVDVFGNACTWQIDYGYDLGQPCVLLKLNKIYGWEPIPYNTSYQPEEITSVWHPDHLAVTCEGESPMDKENIGPVEFYPKTGLPLNFYPYLHQEGYRAPLVFAKFRRPANGVLINVWCKTWARNIKHHRQDRVGSIHFELLVD